MKFLSKYFFFARYLPGLISILPLTLVYFYITKHYSSFSLKEYFESVTFILGISFTFLITFFISMVVREFGSSLEKRYFNNRIGFPTNYLLLYNNDKLPRITKERYRDKIIKDFGLQQLNEVEERTNQFEALKILSQASRFICTRYQQHSQVLDANISYGFARNIGGGLVISLPSSIAGVILALYLKQNSLLVWSIVATAIYSLILVFHKRWIVENAEKFAYKIITVYLEKDFRLKS